MLSTKWDIDTSTENLSYSYFFDNGTNGFPTTSAYNVSGYDLDSLTESNVNSHNISGAPATANEDHLDQAFSLWDDVVNFDFAKVVEDGSSGTTVGEMRVAFTDRASSAAAFAIQPGNGVANGDVWFEAADNADGFDLF